MHLLQSGVDITVIALWLGHEDPATTHLYIEADLAMKEAALRRVADPSPGPLRFRVRDRPPHLPRGPVTMRSTDRRDRVHHALRQLNSA